MKPSETQLDLATGLRARLDGEAAADWTAQVLARLKLACRDPATGGAAPVRTVRPTCAVPFDVMKECRRRGGEPFPDPHDWQPGQLADAGWLRCSRCGDWMREEKTT